MLQGTGICTSVYVGIYMTPSQEAPRRPTAILVAIESISWVSTKLSKCSFDTPQKKSETIWIRIYMKITSMGILGLWKVSDLDLTFCCFCLYSDEVIMAQRGPRRTSVAWSATWKTLTDGKRSVGISPRLWVGFLGSCADVLYITVISAGMEKRNLSTGIRDRSHYVQ